MSEPGAVATGPRASASMRVSGPVATAPAYDTSKRVCAESNLLEQLSIYFRRMKGKLTDAGTHPLPGVLGKRPCENFRRLGDPVRWACPAPVIGTNLAALSSFTTRVPFIHQSNFAE